MEKRSAIVNFLCLFPEVSRGAADFESLSSGAEAFALYQYLQNAPINSEEIAAAFGRNDKLSRLKHLRAVSSGLSKFFNEGNRKNQMKQFDITGFVVRNDLNQLENLFSNLICYSLASPRKEEVVAKIKTMEQNVQKIILEMANSDEEKNVKGEMRISQEVTDNKKKEIEQLKTENLKLKEEIEIIRKSINGGEIVSKIAELNAEMFTLNVQNETKKEKLKYLLGVEEHVQKIEKDIEKSKEELLKLETSLKDQDNYEFLIEQLELLKASPKMKYVNEINDNLNDIKKKIKILNKQRISMQSQIDYQNDINILKQQKDTLKQMEESNVLRLKRAKYNLELVDKKMKNKSYQNDMKSLV